VDFIDTKLIVLTLNVFFNKVNDVNFNGEYYENSIT
jgi:hypothetical protein